MAYIGTEPIVGQYRKLDSIAASFNGSATTFNLTVGSVPVTAGTAYQLLISVGGVVQEPGVDYTVSTNTITFTTAPTTGLSFFGVLMGDTLNIGTPSDGTITDAKLGSITTLNVTNLKHPSSASNNAVLDSTGRALIGVSSANANGGILQLSSGVTFPATQVLSTDPNTLDDYEEGTFTPTIIGTAVAGTGTYSIQVGRYTKIGNRVHFQLYVVSTAHTGSGQMRIAGLPFTANSTSNNYCVVSCYYANVTMTASNVMVAYIDPGSTVVVPIQTLVGGGVGGGITLDPTSEIMFAGSYEV